MKLTAHNNLIRYHKWGLIGISTILWCFVISGVILRYSSSSDFHYTKGKLIEIKRFEQNVKDQIGSKIGTSHTLKFTLSNSQSIFYIDNNFAPQHIGIMHNLDSSKIIEVWSKGDLIDGNEQRVYKLKAAGSVIIPFDDTIELYFQKSYLIFFLALFTTFLSIIVIRPNWFKFLFVESKHERESLVDFYLKKFKDKKPEDLEHILKNQSDFHSDAILAAKQTLKQR